jgi:hypothetical protein
MWGMNVVWLGRRRTSMSGFPSPFGGNPGDAAGFDDYHEFVPDYVPDVGAFLEGHDVLTWAEHAAFHRLTRGLFEERGVYDMTFGYNLAESNLDARHPDAGYRYALERDPVAPSGAAEGESPSGAGEAARVPRAEFTPTTPFCPQSDTLTRGSFRAWNGLSDRHEYDLVRVRVDESHHRAAEINGALRGLEEGYLETGSVEGEDRRDGRTSPQCADGSETGGASRGYGPDAPF